MNGIGMCGMHWPEKNECHRFCSVLIYLFILSRPFPPHIPTQPTIIHSSNNPEGNAYIFWHRIIFTSSLQSINARPFVAVRFCQSVNQVPLAFSADKQANCPIKKANSWWRKCWDGTLCRVGILLLALLSSQIFPEFLLFDSIIFLTKILRLHFMPNFIRISIPFLRV